MGKAQQVRAVRTLSPAAIAALAAAACWAWFASGVRTFTRPAEVLTFIPALAVLVLTLRPKARSIPILAGPAPPWRTFIAWIVMLAAVVGWELSELFSQPRQGHPTLSSITNTLLSTHPSRFLGFLAWLLLGWLMVRDLGPGAPRDEQP
ncbi:MAG TPA: hypothetical protein VHX15_00610 [Frankiaceae bacterium]|jgi:hypothetical protein|nr:hypothetical protein [Frankiaceae bacterium]